MNRIFPYSCKTTRCDTGEVILDEKFDLRLSKSASETQGELIKLSKNDVGVYWDPILPDDWSSLSQEEKSNLVENTEFEIMVEAIYFRSPIGLEEIKKISEYTEIDGLHIYQNSLTNDDIQHLTPFVNLDHLILRGGQFTDDIIEYFSVFKRLRNLDIFETSITDNGLKELKKNLPRCSVWGP
jgi:hypothetical protein